MLLFFSDLPAGKHTTRHSSHSLSGLEELSSIQQLLLPTHLPSLLPLAFLPALEISEAIFLCSTHVALHFVGQRTMLALIFSFFYSKTKAVFISHLSFRYYVHLRFSELCLLYDLLLCQEVGRCLLCLYEEYLFYLQ